MRRENNWKDWSVVAGTKDYALEVHILDTFLSECAASKLGSSLAQSMPNLIEIVLALTQQLNIATHSAPNLGRQLL